jgi:hypothetical protein
MALDILIDHAACLLVSGVRNAIGILLPAFGAGDVFSLYHYRGQREHKKP